MKQRRGEGQERPEERLEDKRYRKRDKRTGYTRRGTSVQEKDRKDRERDKRTGKGQEKPEEGQKDRKRT